MSPLVYQLLHVTSVILLVGFTFQAFAAPTPERRGKNMRNTGLLSVIALVSGFGLASQPGIGFPVWLMMKFGFWFGISVISGMAFRNPEKAGRLVPIAMLLVLGAIMTIYMRPFE
jgi:hypothetical protein